VLSTAGFLTLASAILIYILPDMTKHEMPTTFEDVIKIQFPGPLSKEANESRSQVLHKYTNLDLPTIAPIIQIIP